MPVRYDVSAGIPCESPFEGSSRRVGEEIPADLLEEVAEDFVRQAVVMKQVGFDAVFLHMAYRLTILGRFLSPSPIRGPTDTGAPWKIEPVFPLWSQTESRKNAEETF